MNLILVNIVEVFLILKYGVKVVFFYYIYLMRGVFVISMVVIILFLNGFVIFLVLRDLKKNFCLFLICFFVVSFVLVDLVVGCGLEFMDVFYSFVIVNRKKFSLDWKDL